MSSRYRSLPLTTVPSSMVSCPWMTNASPSGNVSRVPPVSSHSSVTVARPPTVYSMSLADFRNTVNGAISDCEATGGNGLDVTLDLDGRLKGATTQLVQNRDGVWHHEESDYVKYQKTFADPSNSQQDVTYSPLPSSQISNTPWSSTPPGGHWHGSGVSY